MAALRGGVAVAVAVLLLAAVAVAAAVVAVASMLAVSMVAAPQFPPPAADCWRRGCIHPGACGL